MRNPWSWIPTLYFIEGLPYVIVMTLSVIMYKRLDISNTDIALYTSWLYLPWVIKPLWSPFIDLIKTKRFWIVAMQLLMGVSLACVAFTVPADSFFQYTLAFFWLMAFSSATHDIAADGFYMLSLRDDQQAFFVGIRSTFYRVAMLTGQGLIVILAGYLEKSQGIRTAWALTMAGLAAILLLGALYHRFALPHVEEEKELPPAKVVLREALQVFLEFFKKKHIGLIIAFILLYRFGEAQLAKLAAPFLLDIPENGGLGLETGEVGFVYGTAGLIALTLGGILGGIAASQRGLKYWLWPMVAAINLPNAVYIYLAYFQPQNLWTINAAVVIEQFGYGFGFTAYMLYMIYVSEGTHKTAHFALCTGLMALGMMIPGMFSGALQEFLGYPHFFVWVLFATLPAFVISAFIPLDPEFGKKKSA